MKALNRKLLRDLTGMKAQATAIALVIACGVATYVMALSTLNAMVRSQDAYYERYRFAQVFAALKRAPNSLGARIEEIPGVARIQTRIVREVSLDLPQLDEPAVGRLISIPDRQVPIMNDLYLRSGRYPEPGRGEILASEAFTIANQFAPGDRIEAVINGRLRELTIVGIALSPEYIFQIQAGGIFPDNQRFGVLWINESELAAAFDMEGAFNDVALQLMPGANEPEVLRRLDLLTEDYGGLGAHGRDSQVSHRFLKEEIEGLRGMATVSPMIFLGVAAFLLNMVLNRLIASQREQIASLKAFGYGNREIAWHYIGMTSAIIAGGALIGILGGLWVGKGMTEMYGEFYKFPWTLYRAEASVVVTAILVAIAAGLVGVLSSVRRAVSLPPAEGMRPEPPATFRTTLLERIGLSKLLSQVTRMIFRQLERQPLRAALGCLAISFAVAVLVLGSFFKDTTDWLMDFQFNRSERQDATVTFLDAAPRRAEREIAHLPGVSYTEGSREVPVRLRAGHHSRLLAITGRPPDATLSKLLDKHGSDMRPIGKALLVSKKLAELLDVHPGDQVEAEILIEERPRLWLPIAAVVDDYMGLTATMELDALNELMGDGDRISSVKFSLDPKHEAELYREIKRRPGVASVNIKSAAIASWQDTMAENMLRMRATFLTFSCIIAFGVVYNSARISLAERSRELATLRVIGFRHREVASILIGELLWLTAFAIPIGCLLGYGFALWMTSGFNNEFYRFPAKVKGSTFAIAGLVVLGATLISSLSIFRKLGKLDLVTALKYKE
ncbi:MAG: putative ABC transport system permease protein [Verrucomicrobiales bacterium]